MDLLSPITPATAVRRVLHYTGDVSRRTRLAALGIAYGFGDVASRDVAWRVLRDIHETHTVELLQDDESLYNSQIALDVARCCYSPLPNSPGFSKGTGTRRRELDRVLCSVFVKRPHLHYYQGFHDIGAAALSVLAPPAAAEHILLDLLDRWLPYARTKDMKAEKQAMAVTTRIAAHQGSAFARAVAAATRAGPDEGFGIVDGMFALSDIITLLTHGFDAPPLAQRLLDAVLSAPPAFPLYLAAAQAAIECDILVRTSEGKRLLQSPMPLYNHLAKTSERVCRTRGGNAPQLGSWPTAAEVAKLPLSVHKAASVWLQAVDREMERPELWIELVIRCAANAMVSFPPAVLGLSRELAGLGAPMKPSVISMMTTPLTAAVSAPPLLRLGAKVAGVMRAGLKL